MKFIFAGLGAVLSIAYLANIGAGVVDFIPDNLPMVGNIDEFIASAVLLACLSSLGLRPAQPMQKKRSNKTVVDNRLPAPSRNDPLDYNP